MTEMTDVEILRGARALILNVGWTQGVYARDAAGEPVFQKNADAVCYCASGAIWHFLDYERDEWPGRVEDAIYDALKQLGTSAVLHDWQDEPGRTRDEVIGMFDRAIVYAESI